jgi:hypothetical protein
VLPVLPRVHVCPRALLPACLVLLHTARAEKAKAMFPRPSAGPLRPVVRGQTIKYNSKQKLGRGFSLEELKVREQEGAALAFWAAAAAATAMAAAATAPASWRHGCQQRQQQQLDGQARGTAHSSGCDQQQRWHRRKCWRQRQHSNTLPQAAAVVDARQRSNTRQAVQLRHVQ